jgi:tetratricopeptide (TPR) repeat protein
MVETSTQAAILVVVVFFGAQILAQDRTRQVPPDQPKQWPWIAALAILALGTLGMAWDYWGYAHFQQSVTSAERGDIDKALSAVERAQSHDPWMPLYSCHAGYLHGLRAAKGDHEALSAGMERYQQCFAEVPTPGWVDQLNRAALFWQAEQRTEARALAREATSQTPLEWMPWLNRGLWAEMQGDREEAVSSYGWVLSLDPELAGSPFWRQGRRADWWDEIVAAGQQARTERSTGYRSWRWQLAVAAGEWETAVNEIEAWLDDHPGDPGAMAWLGEAFRGQGRPEEAIVWLDRAIAKVPSNARMHIVRGESLLTLGRYDESEQDLRTALFLEPGHRVHLALARLARGVGEEEVALQEYSQALRPLVVAQQSDLVLYRRLSRPAPLPQVVWIGYRQDGEAAQEWGALLEQRGDSDTIQLVYAAALRLDPFLEYVGLPDGVPFGSGYYDK